MKAIALIVTYSLLAVTNWMPATSARANLSSPPAGVQSDGRRTPQHKLSDLHIEPRKGEAVRIRAGQLRNRNKAVARAMKELEDRGMRPAFESGVSILAVSKSVQFRKTAAQTATIINGEYELTLIPYDDGNNATWEGVVYFNRPEGQVVHSTQLDITGTPFIQQETRFMGIGDDGSGSTELYRTVGKNHRPARVNTVSYNPSLQSYLTALTVAQKSALQSWAECAAGGCWAGAAACRMAGPVWAQCAAMACLAIMLSCAIDELW